LGNFAPPVVNFLSNPKDNIGPILPLLKWPGGKRALVEKIISVFPVKFKTYYEPFFGGGAVYFATRSKGAILSDANQELINLYRQVRDAPNELINVLKSYRNSESFYYELRAQSPRLPLRRAARLLFLTTLSFNGIHRVNLNGKFNVPYGYKTHLPVFNEARLLAVSAALQSAKLHALDFQEATATAMHGDLAYFDPPYTVAYASSGFVKYNEKIFSWDDQVRLAEHARVLAARGCAVVVSNADHVSIQELYKDFKVINIVRHSKIAASSEFRRKITEAVFHKVGD